MEREKVTYTMRSKLLSPIYLQLRGVKLNFNAFVSDDFISISSKDIRIKESFLPILKENVDFSISGNTIEKHLLYDLVNYLIIKMNTINKIFS